MTLIGKIRKLFSASRRALFWLLVAISTGWMAYYTSYVLEGISNGLLRAAVLVLFCLCFTWISVPFWMAVIGLLLTLSGRDPLSFERQKRLLPARKLLTRRTAVVMPIYNESSERVFGAMAAMYDGLEKLAPGQFDFFLLSDTRKPELTQREEQLCAVLQSEAERRLYYRLREKNTGKKAGNVADFIERWGSAYDFMTVLDADSVMTPETLLHLSARMEANPQAALIQTVPQIIGAETLFGRMIQFAGRLYGPLLSRGAAFWQGSSANYWGHNAIIRIAPFAEHCGLGSLPGRAPFGGQILSHDFVEAALLNTAGWSVYVLPEMEGSYEELPPTPVEFLQRDKRWSQGNLQHLKLVMNRRLKFGSRTFFVLGAFGYLSSPIWLLLLVLSTSDRIIEALKVHNYFPNRYQLFPAWPVSREHDAIILFGSTLLVLFLPKIGALTTVLRDGKLRASFGGAKKLLLSSTLETLFFVVFAPALMMFHSLFVAQTISGMTVRWDPQNRSSQGISFREAFSSTKMLVFAGLLWSVVLLLVDRQFLLWMLPIVSGLLLSPFLFQLASSYRLGQKAKNSGLFLVPEEREPPAIVEEINTKENWLASIESDQSIKPKVLPDAARTEMPISPVFLP